ncbi:MAG: hypothetical protein VB140_04865 [Burkholderia sp.]
MKHFDLVEVLGQLRRDQPCVMNLQVVENQQHLLAAHVFIDLKFKIANFGSINRARAIDVDAQRILRDLCNNTHRRR